MLSSHNIQQEELPSSKDSAEKNNAGDSSNSSGDGITELKFTKIKHIHDPEDEDDGWGIVETTLASSNEHDELEQTGILIVPGEDEMGGDKVDAVDALLATDSMDMTEQMGTQVERKEGIPIEDPSLPTEIPNENDIPSDLETLPDPMDDQNRAMLMTDEGQSQAPSEGITSLREELEMADALFWIHTGKSNGNSGDSKIDSVSKLIKMHPRALVCLALGFLVMGVFWYERSVWHASVKELRTELESQRQMEMQRLLELASLKEERQLEIANLKQELKQALHEQEEKTFASSWTTTSSPPYTTYGTTGSNSKKRPRPGTIKFPSYMLWDDDDTEMPTGDYQFENCWIQAEAKLGACAKGARNAFRSRLKTVGRSLWHVQEHVVDKVSDLGKRVKEAAERVVHEAEHWSHGKNVTLSSRNKGDSGSNNSTSMQANGKQANFRNMATTLVSSVAFASLAAVVVDKASNYISGMGDEQD